MIYIKEGITSKLPGETSLYVSFEYRPEYVDIIKNSANPGYYDKKTKIWEVPCTCLAILLDNFCVYDDIDLELLQDEKKKEFKTFELSNYRTKPFEYQRDGIQFGLNNEKFLLLDAPGLGKSLQMIYLAQELKEKENIEHCLVICGINTLKNNWAREIKKHSNLDCKILGERFNSKGNLKPNAVKDRLEDLKQNIKEFFVITNIETLRNADIVEEINKGRNKFDMIIVDECHKAKNPTAAQTKGLLKLKCAKHRIGLTGTVLTNSPLDAYVPLKFIDAERGTYTNFKYFYCNFCGTFNTILTGYKNLEVLKEQIEKHSLRRTKDLLNLPEKTVINEYVDMNDNQLNFYENIKDGVVKQVDKVHMSTANLLSMVARLRQATACPSILTTENIESSKIDRTVDLIEQIINNGDKVVVYSTFKETLNQLQEKISNYKPLLCTGDVKDSIINENINKFQEEDEYKVILCTHQKMGTGITLTSATYAIFIDTPWTSADYSQCQDRIHRIGSNKPVFIYNLICKNTIDERVLEIVNDKEALGDYIVDDKITSKGINSLRKYIEDLE